MNLVMMPFIVALMVGQSITPRPKPDYLLPYTPPPPKPADEIHHPAPAPKPEPKTEPTPPPKPVQSQAQIDANSLSQMIANDVSNRVMATQAQIQESVSRTQAAVAELTKSVSMLADMQALSNAKQTAPKTDPALVGATGKPVKIGNQYAAADSRGQWWYDDDPEKVAYAVEYYNRRNAGIPVRQATTTYESAGYQATPPVQGVQAAPYAAPGAAASGAACYSSAPPATSYAAPATSYAAPMSYAAPATAATSCYSGAPQTMSYGAPAEVYAAMPSYGAPAVMAAPADQVEIYRRGIFGRERRVLFSGPSASSMRARVGLFGTSVCGPFGCP